MYIPCFAIITVSFLLWYGLYSPENKVGYEDWLGAIWSEPITGEYMKSAYLLNAYYVNIDPVLWTLPVEIKLSLLFPFFLYFFKKLNVFWSCACIPLYMILYHTAVHFGVLGKYPFFVFLYYFTFFMIGAFLSKYREKIVGWFNRLPAYGFYLFCALAITIYTCSQIIWWLPEKIQHILIMQYAEYIAGIAAPLLLCLAISERLRALLSSAFLLWLGKISFSLYLTHMVIIASVVCLFGRHKNFLLLLPVSMLSIFLFAILFYYLVEEPSMNWAKRTTSWFKKESS